MRQFSPWIGVGIFIVFFLALSCGAQPAIAEGKDSSTSISRQFIVYGADAELRGAICDLAETTKSNLLEMLQLSDQWKTPLVINLDYPQANLPELPASSLDFSQTGAGLKLQLDLLVLGGPTPRGAQRELLRATLIEMMYRSRTNIAVGARYFSPPDWLLDGVLLSMPQREKDEAVQLLATAVATGRIEPLETIVRQRRDLLEPPSREIHDAYSMALVQLLLGAPDGPRKLTQYVADLPDAPNDAYADLRVHFPTMLGDSADKWWSLSVAQLSARDRYEILSAGETAARLDRLLRVSLSSPAGQPHLYSLGDYAKFLSLPGARAALRGQSEQLLLLAAQAHPIYRPVVQELYQIIALLARGKRRKIGQRLARVKQERTAIAEQCRGIDDYMNWYQATQLQTISGAFSDLLESASATDSPARRRDPISVYLDSLEAQVK